MIVSPVSISIARPSPERVRWDERQRTTLRDENPVRTSGSVVCAIGVYSLWILADTAETESRIHAPEWIKVTSATDLKVQLLEVVAVLLAVLFLKGVMSDPQTVWSDLVVPIAVVLFAGAVWLIREAGH